MLSKRKIFKFILLSLTILCVHSLNSCIRHGETCDPNNGIKCCDENLICKQTTLNDLSVCFKEAQLGEHCEINEDCDTVAHAKCLIDKKCACRSKYIQKNITNCSPSVGEYCWRSDQCGTKNSICIDYKCQCKNTFFLDSIEDCLPIIIGKNCNDDTDCSQIKFAKCSSNKICACTLNTVALTPALCYPLLNVTCQVDEDCKVDYSVCIENKCECKPKHKALHNNQCTPMYLGMPCKHDLECRVILNNTVCAHDKTCTCDYNYFQTKDGICKLESERSCLDEELCNDENSVCIDKNCQCKPQYVFERSKCVPTTLFGSCHTGADCHRIRFALCSNDKKCTCKDDYVNFSKNTCIPKLGGICHTDDQCFIRNSTCIDNQCQCKYDYLNVADKQCVLMESADRTCSKNNPNCRLFTNAKCSEIGQCLCTEYEVQINSTACTVSSGEFCINNDQCGSEYSVCVRNKCKCKFEYVSHADIDCPAPYLGMPCQYDLYCKKFIDHAVCLTNKCVCDNEYSPINDKVCLPILNVPCWRNEPCTAKNSICIDDKCQCEPEYIQQGLECVTQQVEYSYNCLSKNDCNESNSNTSLILAKSCTSDSDCWGFRNTRCSSNNICVCKANSFATNDNFCYSVLNGFCVNDEQCGINFHCVGFNCQCKPNFLSASVDQCVPSHRLYSCNDDTDCSDPWHSKCSKNKKCVCNVNNIAINKSTCLPLLNGYCWRDDQCTARNSICDDYRCTCKPNYVAIADNLCARKN